MTKEQTSVIGVAVGSRVRIDPSSAMGKDSFGLPRRFSGTVVYINQANRWFLVEWGPGLRSGFKMDDLGGEVTVCG